MRPERSHIVWATVTGIPVLTLIGLVVLGYVYDWGWVGVSEAIRPKPADQALRWEKTLWDWLQLLVVPVAVAVGTFALNQAAKKREEESQQEQREREQSIEEQSRKNDLEIEERRAHEAALNTYLDQMGQMLLAEGLRSSEEDADLRVLARARTLTTLGRIGPAHKGSILRFLQEASLINKKKPVIRLFSADLSGADLELAPIGEGRQPGPVSKAAVTFPNNRATRAHLHADTLPIGAALKRALEQARLRQGRAPSS